MSALALGRSAPHVVADAYVRGVERPQHTALADYAGKWIVLFFYPRDFSAVCPDELQAFGALHDAFEAEDAVVLGASTDGYWSHRAWFESHTVLRDIRYPVLADPAHELSAAYGVLLQDGSALRATIVIDPEGEVRHLRANDTATTVGRSPDETLRVLQALRTGGLSPTGWRPGQPSLADAA